MIPLRNGISVRIFGMLVTCTFQMEHVQGIHFSAQNRQFRTPAVNRVIAQCNDLTHKITKIEKGFTYVPTSESPRAEAEGFEPPVRVNGLRFSRPTHSTTLPNLRCKFTRNPNISMASPEKN